MQHADPDRKVFLLGVGCPKGGTTWLYDYLKRHPQVAPGFAKEYHVLTTHFRDDFRAWQDRRIAEARALMQELDRPGDPRKQRALARLREVVERRERQRALARDLDLYVGYFADLARRNPGARLVCDITPTYFALEATALSEVRARLERAGFDVRIVFILREPIERSFSYYRMNLSHSERKSILTGANPIGSARNLLAERAGRAAARLRHSLARSPEAKLRSSPFLGFVLEGWNLHASQYERTIGEIERAFPPEKVHLAFYETLFNEEALRRFTDFAGIDFVPGAYRVRKNRTAVKSALSPFEISFLRERLVDTYSYCNARFGRDFIEGHWKHA